MEIGTATNRVKFFASLFILAAVQLLVPTAWFLGIWIPVLDLTIAAILLGIASGFFFYKKLSASRTVFLFIASAILLLVPVFFLYLIVGLQNFELGLTFFGIELYAVTEVPLIISLILTVSFFYLWIASLIARVALRKGRDWGTFFALSLFFPVITWIVAAVIPTDQATSASGTKKCPRCAELVKLEATLCKHCGSEI